MTLWLDYKRGVSTLKIIQEATFNVTQSRYEGMAYTEWKRFEGLDQLPPPLLKITYIPQNMWNNIVGVMFKFLYKFPSILDV